MTADIADLVGAGLDGATIVIGVDGSPSAAAELAEAGARLYGHSAADSGVAAFLTNDRASVELILGAIVAGGRLVSLPLPARAADPLAFGAFVQAACATYGISTVVARDDVAALLGDIGVATRPHSMLGADPLAAPAPGGFELVQFSSGSTARPKGIALNGGVLGVNVSAILERVRPQPGDVTVSWLPLSHDMGLIGMLISSVAACSPLWVGKGTIVLLEPEAFLRSPRMWIEALDHWHGTFTAAPDFGYRVAAERRPSTSVNLRQLRCAIIGGDIVRADTLRGVLETFGDDGLDAHALCPAYGMAELGLAATMTPPSDLWRAEAVDVGALAGYIRSSPKDGTPGLTMVASGNALDGYRIEVEAGAAEVGQIRIFAPESGVDADTGSPLVGGDGAFETGDVGFMSGDGWLYVCGRGDDHLLAHGRNLYAPAVENAVSLLPGVRAGRVTAVGLPTGDWIVAVEWAARTPPTVQEALRLRQDVRRAAVSVASAAPSQVVLVAPGHLPMTGSGKVQRHEVRRRWVTGTL